MSNNNNLYNILSNFNKATAESDNVQPAATKEKTLLESTMETVSEKYVDWKNSVAEGKNKETKMAKNSLTKKKQIGQEIDEGMIGDLYYGLKRKVKSLTDPEYRELTKASKTNKELGRHINRAKSREAYSKLDKLKKQFKKDFGQEIDEETKVSKASYSAKKARAGQDIGKPGKQFAKIAKGAAERYGSKERGEKVAGVVLKKLRANEDVSESTKQSSNIQKQIIALYKKGLSDFKIAAQLNISRSLVRRVLDDYEWVADTTGEGDWRGKDVAESTKQISPVILEAIALVKSMSDAQVNEAINEVLSKSATAGEWISDFVHSDNPKFKGKSKAERKRMALGAYYAAHPKKSRKEENVSEAKAKKADKDYDGDGKIESPKDEVWGSRLKAAKKAGKLEEGVAQNIEYLDAEIEDWESKLGLDYEARNYVNAARDAFDSGKFEAANNYLHQADSVEGWSKSGFGDEDDWELEEGVTVHKGTYGTSYQGDDDDDEDDDNKGKKAKKPAKKGKVGRPTKDDSKKYSSDALSKAMRIGAPKKLAKATRSHSLKESMDTKSRMIKEAFGANTADNNEKTLGFDQQKIKDALGDELFNQLMNTVKSGDDFSNEVYEALFDYFSDTGEMPYDVAKARDGDPYEWIADKVEELFADEAKQTSEPKAEPSAEPSSEPSAGPDALKEMKRLAGLSECGMSPIGGTAQQSRMDVTTTMSSDGNKTVSINASGDSAEDLIQMLKLAGLNSGSSSSNEEPAVAVVSTEPEEEMAEEKDPRYEASTTPDETVLPVQAQTKGGDGDVAGEEKQQNPHGYKFGDNPEAMRPVQVHPVAEGVKDLDTMGMKLMREYESIKVKK